MKHKIINQKQIILSILAFLMNFIHLSAQTTYYLTVSELFQKGIENSIKIKSSQSNLNIANEIEDAAKINRLPNIDVNIVGGYIADPTVFLGAGLTRPTRSEVPNWLQNYDISLTQPIYRGGKIEYNIEKAALLKEIVKLNVERDKSDIKLLLIGKYLGLFKLYKERDVLNENISDAKQRLHDIQGMKKEGMITENDVIRSELELTNYELALREINDNIEIISQQLDIALGLDENLLLVPDTTELNAKHSLLSYEDYVNEAYKQHTDMKIIHFNMELAEKNLQLAKADYLPALSFRATNYLDRPILKTTPPLDYFTNSWTLSLILSYNVSSLYQNRSNIGIGKENILIQELQEEQQKQNIRTNIKAAYVKHKEAIDRVDVLLISTKQADENYRIVQNKYFNKLSVLTDLLDATTVRLRTEMQLTEAKANVIFTYYQLLKASGSF